MSSAHDDIRPISAPNDGPDPRVMHPVAPGDGPDPRGVHQVPEPDGRTDVRDLDPAPGTADPGFASGGLGPMTSADAAPVATAPLPAPPGGRDVRDLDPAPGTADPGFASGGLRPLSAADAGGGRGHALETPDRPVDVRDLDPAPGQPSGGGDVQAMAAGGPGGDVRSNSMSGMSGVDDPAALGRAGQAANELGDHVARFGKVGEDERMWGAVGALAGDLWGGELGAALSTTMESWDRQAEKLRQTCLSIGERCTQTANNYTTTETANESEMNSVRSSLADFN